jgi:MtrB/PioB family decaheme-associated outer membrane protein
MNRKILVTLSTAPLCCAFISANLFAADVPEDENEFDVTSSTMVGVQASDIDGDEAGAQKYRDGLEDTVVLEQLEVNAIKADFFFNLQGRDLGQDDGRLVAKVGKYGKYEIEGSWDSTVRHYADGTFLGTLTPGGYWTIPDSTQALLEANFTPLNERPSAAEQQVLHDVLLGAETVSMQNLRETGELKMELTPIKGLSIRAGFNRQTKNGNRAMSTGSYRRDKTGAEDFGGVGENFMLYGLEIPTLIDFETNTMDLGLGWRKGNWFADLSYRFVDFANGQDYVTWDNPLLLTNQETQGGAALNRLDLAPEYRSSMFSITGGASDLPLKSRLNATLSWDKISQDDDFLANTVNTAITDPDGVVAATRPLPASDLDGDVTTTLINVVWNSRPLPKTSVNVRYNSYDYENDTPRIDWDGYVRIAESNWKSADYVNRTPAFKKSRYGIDGSYRFGRNVKFLAEYVREDIDRNDHRAASNKEDILGATLVITANDWTSLRFKYTGGDRSINGDYTAAIEQSHGWQQAYMYDMSERDRKRFDAYISMDPTDQFSTGLSLIYTDDSYDNAFYGLHDTESLLAGFDINYRFSDKTNLSFYVSYEDRDTGQLNRTKSDANGNGAFAVPENDWQTDLSDSTSAFGIVFDTLLVADKLDLTLSFDQSKGKGTFSTFTTNYVQGVTTSGATGYDWPNVTSDSTEFKLQLNYRWTENLLAGFRYYYDRYKLNDFATDDVALYSGEPSDQQGNAATHFIFMGANHFDYEVHFVALTLTYEMR